MKDNIIVNGVTEETLAAYFDGVATAQECDLILKSLDESDELSEIMSISMAVDRDLTLSANHIEILPMRAAAASAGSTCTCSLECEKYILNRRGIAYDEEKLMEMSLKNNWQTDEGTALHNIGRHLEHKGLSVIRRYKCSIDDIIEALAANDDIIVAVDGGELLGDPELERREDILIGEIPDHSVVVVSCDKRAQTITIFDPNSGNTTDTYHIEHFRDAWEDSKNYMVTSYIRGSKEYTPKPINLEDVVINSDINELKEAIAENAHEIWASSRKNDGWCYGPRRDDTLKQTPNLVPYTDLPDEEKHYDRVMAMETIKLIYKLGYDIVKFHDTELYSTLRERITHADKEAVCPRCGALLYIGQRYCDRCGEQIVK
jgi:hypothetical protein